MPLGGCLVADAATQCVAMSILSFVKGALGELQGRAASKFFLDEEVYRSLHNVTIPAKGGTAHRNRS
jgi:hypothetical protein